MSENKDRLDTIAELIAYAMSDQENMRVKDYNTLVKIHEIATDLSDMVITPPQLDHVIISCDASITENPGGQAAVGFVVELPKKLIKSRKMSATQGFSKKVPATTNNQAEYDAVYEALTTFFSIHNNPQCKVEIRSDSRLVIEQLKGNMKCNDPELLRRRDLIQELVTALPVEIEWSWRPRNSTPAITQANYLAQDELNVPRH